MTQFGYVVIALVLLLVIASASPKYGGALIIVIVLGMVYAGYKRHVFSTGVMQT